MSREFKAAKRNMYLQIGRSTFPKTHKISSPSDKKIQMTFEIKKTRSKIK